MQVSVEASETLERRMTVELPVDQVKQAVDKRLKEIAKTVRLAGFRPGKVPISVVRKRYAGQVRQEVLGEMVKSSFPAAISQEGLKPAGMPDIEPLKMESEEGMGYVAVFEVVPEVELADISGEAIKRPSVEISEDDQSQMIEKLRRQRMTWNEVDRAAGEKDQATINFKGTIDGEAFEGGSADAVPLELDSEMMIPGFEQGLIGAKTGENRTLDLKFPDDYRVEKLAGKAVTFEVEVSKVAEPVLPEIDEAFARAFGVNDGDIAVFHQEIRANMERELKEKIDSMVKEQAMDILLKINAVEAPKAMVKQEAAGLLKQTNANMQQSGQASNINLPLELFEEQATKRVKLGLILAEVVKQQQIKVDDKRVRARVEQSAESYEKPQELIDFYYSKKENLATVENIVLEDQVVDWILSQVNVETPATAFDEVMNPVVNTPD